MTPEPQNLETLGRGNLGLQCKGCLVEVWAGKHQWTNLGQSFFFVPNKDKARIVVHGFIEWPW